VKLRGRERGGNLFPPHPPNMGIFFGGEVCTSFAWEAINWDLSVSLGKGILQKINHKPVGGALVLPKTKDKIFYR